MKLVPMQEEEFRRYLDAALDRYARDVAVEHGMPLSEARAKAGAQVRALLPKDGQGRAHEFYFLEDDGRVGTLWLAAHDEDIYVYDIFVDQEHRGRGVGSRVMAWIEEQAKERGVDSVSLSVFAHNEGAIRLYERLGYEVVEKAKGGQRMRKRVKT